MLGHWHWYRNPPKPPYWALNLTTNVTDVTGAQFHLYADDMVIYCSVLIFAKEVDHLQNALSAVQNTLSQLKLVVSDDKTKLMLFPNAKNIPQVVTLEGQVFEGVNLYKYLGILIDDCFTFKTHVQCWVKKKVLS